MQSILTSIVFTLRLFRNASAFVVPRRSRVEAMSVISPIDMFFLAFLLKAELELEESCNELHMNYSATLEPRTAV